MKAAAVIVLIVLAILLATLCGVGADEIVFNNGRAYRVEGGNPFPAIAKVTLETPQVTVASDYYSPWGWHRHRLSDGRILEHADSNNGSYPAHADAEGWRDWRGWHWPKYAGPLPPDVVR